MTAEKRRKSRTTQEILTDDILKRASASQLFALLKLPEFRGSREKIQQKLLKERHLSYESFKKVHTMEECVLEKKTGRKIRTISGPDIDHGTVYGSGTLDQYHCIHHDVLSGQLVTDEFGRDHPYRPR